jgi:hypothetical protein
LGDASVGRHHNQWSQLGFQSSVEEGEAFNVEHVNFVDEKDLNVPANNQPCLNRPSPAPTPGTISALPSSLHSDTLALICSRNSGLISPVSPKSSVSEIAKTSQETVPTSKQGQESLRLAVDDVNLVQGHGVNDFLSRLQFSIGTLHEFGLPHPKISVP